MFEREIKMQTQKFVQRSILDASGTCYYCDCVRVSKLKRACSERNNPVVHYLPNAIITVLFADDTDYIVQTQIIDSGKIKYTLYHTFYK